MVRAARSLACCLVALGAGCATAPRPDLPALAAGLEPSSAAALAARTSDPALAAEILWLDANDRAGARARLDAGLADAPNAPELRLRRALLSIGELRHAAAFDDLTRILRDAPQSPEAEVALALLHERGEARGARRTALAEALEASGLLSGPPASTAGRVTLAANLRAQIAHHDQDDAGAEAALERGGFVTRMRCIGPLAPAHPGGFESAPRYERSGDWSSRQRFRGRPSPIREVLSNGAPGVGVPGGAPGLYVYDTYFEISEDAADSPVVLEARLPGSARVRIDDGLVLVRDAARRLDGRLAQVELRLEPGWHRLAVAVLARADTRLHIALTTASGRPLSGASRSGPVAGAPAAPEPAPPRGALGPQGDDSAWGLVRGLVDDPARGAFGRLLGARLAGTRWYRDPDRAWWLLQGTVRARPRSAAFGFAWARLQASRGLTTLAQSRLQEGLRHDPEHPGAATALARLLRDEQPERALTWLDVAARAAPEAWDPPAVRVSVLRRLGWNAEAHVALTAALERAPPARVLGAAVRFLRGIERNAEAEEVAKALDRQDPRGASARAADRAELRADLDGAIAARREAAVWGDPARHLTRIAELELSRLDAGAAARAAEAASRADPSHPPARRAALRAALLAEDRPAAHAALRELTVRGDSSLELESLLEDLTPATGWLAEALRHDPWQGVRVGPDGLAPGRDPADRWARHDSVVLLDRVVDHVLPDGRVRSWHHDITRLQTKEAADRAGEIAIPPDALVSTLRTLKPDGRAIEVDRHSGKDDLSFSALAPGDAIEVQWVQIEGASTSFGGYLRRFFLRAGSPLVRSEFAVVVPKGAKVWFDRRNGAPAPRIEALGDDLVYLWRADDVAAAPPEPYVVGAEEHLPHVIVAVDLDPRLAAESNLSGGVGEARGSRQVDARARALTQGLTSPQAKLTALFRWVVEHLDHGPARPPEIVLSTQRGARSGVLVALARAAGVPAELVWARNGLAPPLAPNTPAPRGFDTRLVRLEPRPGQVQWARLDGDRPWMGALPPRFAGGAVLRRGPRGPLVESLTADQVGDWAAGSEVVLRVDRDGHARGHVALTIPAGYAVGTRAFLRSARAQVIDRQLQGLVARLLRGARLVNHRAEPLEDPLEDLVLTLEIELSAFMTREGPHLIAEELFERPLALPLMGHPRLDAYLGAASRQTPMLIRPALEHMRVILKLPPGTQLTDVKPTQVAERIPHGDFSQRFDFDADRGEARLEVRYQTHLGRVPPERFEAFAAAAQDVLQALRNRLVVRVAPAAATATAPRRPTDVTQ